MSKVIALSRFATVAEGGRARPGRASNKRNTLLEFERAEPVPHDYDTLAAYVGRARFDEVECHRLLARSLAPSYVASQVFARFPNQMAELCIRALRPEGGSAREVAEREPRPAQVNTEGADRQRIKVFVLGRFQLFKDKVPIRFWRRAQRKPLELLQALIAFGGTEIGACKIIDVLWPDSEGDAAYHALESALYRLRRLLGVPNAVSMIGGKLTLDRRQFWVDMWDFERELRSGNVDGRSPFERLARMRELYSGHFLEQEIEKPWAVERRQILRDKLVGAIRDFARSYENGGLWQEAAAVYRAGIEVDALAEDFHRGLIMCQRELGDHGAAVQSYGRCRELLLKTLGVQPSAKTLALYQSVRHEAMRREV